MRMAGGLRGVTGPLRRNVQSHTHHRHHNYPGPNFHPGPLQTTAFRHLPHLRRGSACFLGCSKALRLRVGFF